MLQVREEMVSSDSDEDEEFIRSLRKRREARAARREAARSKSRKEEKRKKKVVVESSSSEEIVLKKKKKKKAAPSSSSGSSEEEKIRQRDSKRRRMEMESSPEEEEIDNWTKLAPLWPVEQRPKLLQCRATVNSHSMKELMKMEKMYRNQEKKMGKADRLFAKDPALPVVKVKSGKDDRRKELHESTFFRMPTVDPEEYWGQMPTSREPIYRHIPLKHCGAENAVNELVVVRMHDRGTPVSLKMFHGKNYVKRPNAEAMSLDGGWEAPLKMRFIQEALANHAVVSRSLWPLDYTPEVIQRVLIRNNWGGVGETDAVKAGLITDFFDDLMTENADRSTRGKEPADHRRGKELWADVCERHGVSGTSGVPSRPAAAKGGDGNGGNGGGKQRQQQGRQWENRGGNGGGAPGGGRQWDGRFQQNGVQGRTAAKVGSIFVCHRFNEPQGCGRPKQGQGCRGWNGQVFAHNCNATKPNGEYCLEVHPKKDHN